MLDLLGYIILTSLSWNIGSLLIKQGLYDTPPISSMLMKSLIFFLVSVGLAVFYFFYKKKRVDIKKLKRGFKYFIPAVALTYFIGTFSLLNLLNKSEKISVAIFLQSVFSLFVVSILSFLFLNEKLNFTQIIGIIIGLIGTGIIILNSNLYTKK
tara:strand:+ start:774 stop:1235 length:462 start_codon:yes stop_codon:yes gene_type:complete